MSKAKVASLDSDTVGLDVVGSGSVCGVLGIGEEDAEVVVGVDALG